MAQKIHGNAEVKQTSDSPLISNEAKIGVAMLAIAAIALTFAQIKYRAVSSLIGLAVANPIPTFVISLLVVGTALYVFVCSEAFTNEEDTNPEIEMKSVHTNTDRSSKCKDKKSALKKTTAYAPNPNHQTPQPNCEGATGKEGKKSSKHVHFPSPNSIAKSADAEPTN